MGTKLAKQTAQLSLPGFDMAPNGLIANKSLTRDQWEGAGTALCQVSARLNWYVGDWLGVSKGKDWEHGDLEKLCDQFDLNYQTARNAKSVCDEFQMSRRRDKLTFSHHQEVQGRDDAEELLDWCEETTPPRSRKELRQEKAARRQHELAARHLPEGKYSVIYADPPWEYNSGDQHTNESQETVLGTHYPSMPLSAICEMPVDALAADGCVLFLWCTSPTLEEAMEVVNAWGFEYKASMVWDKVKHNVGHYVSVRHELLLICKKGQLPKVPKLVDSVYVEERNVHSRKPMYFRNLIDELYPNGKRIELFAREQVEGWEVWGNETANV